VKALSTTLPAEIQERNKSQPQSVKLSLTKDRIFDKGESEPVGKAD
jgi:hypothetical protein